MDTKLKNYHKTAVGLITLLILCASLVMTLLMPVFTEKQPIETNDIATSESFLQMFIRNNYVLYFREKATDSSFSPYDIFFPGNTASDAFEQESSKTDKPTETKSSELIKESAQQAEQDWESEKTSEDYMGMLDFVEERYDSWNSHFEDLLPFMEYEVRSEDAGKVLYSNIKKGTNLMEKMQAHGAGTPYAFFLSVTYDNKGYPASVSFWPTAQGTPQKTLKSLAISDPYKEYYDHYGLTGRLHFQLPKSRIYTYAMTEENLRDYLTSYPETAYDIANRDDFHINGNSDALMITLLIIGLIIGISALILPFIKSFNTGDEKIFHAPLELVCLICIVSLTAFICIMDFIWVYSPYNFAWEHNLTPMQEIFRTLGIPGNLSDVLLSVLSFTGWSVVFALIYWAFGCLRRLFWLGPKVYIQRHVLTYRFIRYFGGGIFRWLKKTWLILYDSFLHVDLTANTTKLLLKAVLLNFIICAAICIFWFFGIGALVLYSVVLFFLLRKYIQQIQEQYHRLLEATNELAKGNLNGTIPDDLGVFEPFREEIVKIQAGFKKAVDEEVKSTRMKTDLITNVSHDLKTPLTAIITYVDLLKQEDLQAEEEKKYIQILDQKTNRLKFLIEDLFEVSKATSKAVTLNIMDVDIVSLMQQVKLELQDKIDATNLIFRWQMPEDKVILPLDSQRTYRVFENLLVNITKYAMPHTRVYITIENTSEQVKITMKNISATELDFNPNEITERFVRGDVSRNTEGSGLGLAIAKSFTELQGGKLEISTDADLFTVEITFLK